MSRGTIQGDTSISGSFNVEKWREFRNDLIRENTTEDDWQKAFDLLSTRISTRFLNPINWILEKRTDKGEGFSVVAIQCILIEFLEAFYQGKVYTTAEKPQPFEYKYSKALFSDFLMNHKPFSDYFTTKKKAAGFYDNVRCGLLHEAATKESSRINNASGAPNSGALVSFESNDPSNMRVYRENLHKAILNFIDFYKQELLVSKEIQRNFIRKMDDICGIRHAYYFAYGSNMDPTRLTERIGKYHTAHLATLRGYKFLYNKKSIDGSAKANLEEDADSVVYGICYEIDKNDFDALDRCEDGYERKRNIDIILFDANNNKPYTAKAAFYISKPKNRLILPTEMMPLESYKRIIIKGARYWKLDESYIQDYLNSQCIDFL